MSCSMEAAPAAAATHISGEPKTRPRFSRRRAYAHTISATVVIRGVGVVSGVLAARLLGPAGRGELAVIIFLPMLLVPVGELELPRSVAFEVSRLDWPSDRFLATSFWLALALGVVQAILLTIALPLYLPSDKLYLLPTAFLFAFYLPATFVSATLMGSDQGAGRFDRFSFFLALPGSLYLGGILVCWFWGCDASTTFAESLLAATLLTVVAKVWVERRGSFLRSSPDWSLASRLLRRGFTYYLPAIAGFLLARADMLIVVRLAPVQEIGLYAVAQAVAIGQSAAANPFLHVAFASVAAETQQSQALRAVARHFRFAQLAILAAATATAVVTPWAIRLLFGSNFVGAVFPALLLIAAAACWGMAQVLELGLRAASHLRIGIASNLLGLAALLGVAIPECARHGIVGLAASLVFAQLLNLAVLLVYCVAVLGIPPRDFYGFRRDSWSELKRAAASFFSAQSARREVQHAPEDAAA